MRVALLQYSLTSDTEENLSKALRLLEKSAELSADVSCFPELCLSPFFPQYAGHDASRYVMKVDDYSINAFREACKRLQVIGIPNVYLEEDGKRFDASLIIDSAGELLGISKMVHIAQLPCFYEQDYYAPSDTGFQVYGTPEARIGVVVCFDRHFPESVRSCVLQGAQLIVIPTANTTAEPSAMFEWELRVAAMQNGVYIAMCNRIGPEGSVCFSGESLIVDPNGDVLTKAAAEEAVILADIDLGRIQEARQKRPYLSLRRPSLYRSS